MDKVISMFLSEKETVCFISQVMRLIRLAEQKAKQLSEMLQASLKKHDVERVQARIRRHHHTPSAPQLQGRAVTVLNSSDVIGWAHHQIDHTHYCPCMPQAPNQYTQA